MGQLLLLRSYLETVYKKKGADDPIFLHGVRALKHQEDCRTEEYGMRMAGYCPECHQQLPPDQKKKSWWETPPGG
jgi:hypothetical protein